MWYYILNDKVSEGHGQKKGALGSLEEAVGKKLRATGKKEDGVYTYNNEYLIVKGLSTVKRYAQVKETPTQAKKAPERPPEPPQRTFDSFEDELSEFISKVLYNNRDANREVLGGQYAKGYAYGLYVAAKKVMEAAENHDVDQIFKEKLDNLFTT